MGVSDPLALAALTLLHLLVLVYWLGGDLGAFVASHVLTDPKAAAAGRLAAARILNDVDMAPRTALALAFPTGLVLLAAKGISPVPLWAVAAVAAMGLAWALLIWALHLRHAPPASVLRRLDLGLRWLALAGLGLIGAGFGPEWPLYLRLKCLALAAAIACGLLIRAKLAAFAPALAALAKGAATPADEAALRAGLAGARTLVIIIWALVASAALLGLWRPQ
jgi:hypothetical protein